MFIESLTLPVNSESGIYEKVRSKLYGQYGELDNRYPCGLFGSMGLEKIYFNNITIFYGSNGSGKSTLLNIIAEKLKLNRVSPFNSGSVFDSYSNACQCTMGYDDEGFVHRIPDGSRIITSDDVFDYMLAMRSNNDQIDEDRQIVAENYMGIKYGESVRMRSLDDYEALRDQVQARRKTVSRKKFITQVAGEDATLQSNGETALGYFEHQLKTEKLYCLDEPENSMSPKMQLELVKLLEESVRFFGCQLIISTHSPFLLAMNNTKIYDLDSRPVTVKDWWDLENPRLYFEFFYKHRKLFMNADEEHISNVNNTTQNKARRKVDEETVSEIKNLADKHMSMLNRLVSLDVSAEVWQMIGKAVKNTQTDDEYRSFINRLSYLAENTDDYHSFIGTIEEEYNVKTEKVSVIDKEVNNQQVLMSGYISSLYVVELFKRNTSDDITAEISEIIKKITRDNKNRKFAQLVIVGILYAFQEDDHIVEALEYAFPDFVMKIKR